MEGRGHPGERRSTSKPPRTLLFQLELFEQAEVVSSGLWRELVKDGEVWSHLDPRARLGPRAGNYPEAGFCSASTRPS